MERLKRDPETKSSKTPKVTTLQKQKSETLFPLKKETREMINVSCKYTKWNWDLHLRYWPSLFGQDDWILAKFFSAFFYGARRKERIFSRGKKAGNDGSIFLAAHWQPIRTQDSLQLVRTWIQPYDKCNSRFHLEGNRLATRTLRMKKQQQSRVFFDVIIDVYTHVDDRERARARETNFVGRKT